MHRFDGRAPARVVLTFLIALPGGTACSSRHPDAASPAPVHGLTGPEQNCASCHPKHVEEWRSSSHAYAMKDPVFHAMLRLGQRETKGVLNDFCVKCHSPIGNATGQTIVSQDPATGLFSQRATGLDTDAMDGVSCLVCHSITRVNVVANADFEMKRDDVRRGPIQDPASTSAHRSEYSPLHVDTEICGSCHDVVNPKNVPLEQTHVEWVQSGFNGGKTCQDCHMPASRGPAALGYDTRTVHEHRFVGVDVSLLPEDEFPGYDDGRSRADELLKTSATLTLTAAPDGQRLAVDIQNLAGHALPSGATADRELWVELLVTDSSGSTVFESGTLDDAGNLRVDDGERTTRPGTDPALILYTEDMLLDPKVDDPASTDPAVRADFLWEPNAESSHLIHAEETAHRSYDFSTLPSGTYTASARLLFRAFPPHLLAKLEREAGLDPAVRSRVPTVEMATATATITR